MHTLDISLENAELYKGCVVNRFGVKYPTLETQMVEGMDIVRRNAERIFASMGASREQKGDVITLVAPPKLYWSAAVVISAAIGFFNEVRYSDKSGEKVVYPMYQPTIDLPKSDA